MKLCTAALLVGMAICCLAGEAPTEKTHFYTVSYTKPANGMPAMVDVVFYRKVDKATALAALKAQLEAAMAAYPPTGDVMAFVWYHNAARDIDDQIIDDEAEQLMYSAQDKRIESVKKAQRH